jgi:hypothetical protein
MAREELRPGDDARVGHITLDDCFAESARL